MKNIHNTLLRIIRDNCGQDIVEYALLVGLIGTTAVATLPGLVGNLSILYSRLGSVAVVAAQ